MFFTEGTPQRTDTYYQFLTFDVLSEAHGRGHVLAFAAGLLLHHVVIAGDVAGRAHLLRLPPLVARRKLFGEGKHGEDDEEHSYGAQKEAAPPAGDSGGFYTGSACVKRSGQLCGCTWVYLPVANKAGVTLVDVDDSFGVDIEADEDASQEVAGCWTQGSHHIHDG